MAERRWQGRSHGGRWGTALVGWVARLGLLPVHLFVLFPTLWFLWRDHQARRHALRFWRHLRPDLGRWGRLVACALHFWTFARVLTDRVVAVLAPQAIRQTHRGEQAMSAAMASRHGCLLLSAHVGGWELAGRWLTRYSGVRFHLAMLRAEDPRVEAELRRQIGDHPLHLIDLADPIAAGVAVINALRAGDTVCMLADRTLGDTSHSLRVPFLGRPARFPTGPFLAAVLTGAWIVPTFTVMRGLGDYVMTAWPPFRITPAGRSGRAQALDQAAARFAEALARTVRQHPRQWFNFYDFW